MVLFFFYPLCFQNVEHRLNLFTGIGLVILYKKDEMTSLANDLLHDSCLSPDCIYRNNTFSDIQKLQQDRDSGDFAFFVRDRHL